MSLKCLEMIDRINAPLLRKIVVLETAKAFVERARWMLFGYVRGNKQDATFIFKQ